MGGWVWRVHLHTSLTPEQRATLALWAVPGLGPEDAGGPARVRRGLAGPLVGSPVREWLAEAPLLLARAPPAGRRCRSWTPLADAAAGALRVARGMELAFAGERAFPERLGGTAGCASAPLLQGAGGAAPAPRGHGGQPPSGSGLPPFARTFAAAGGRGRGGRGLRRGHGRGPGLPLRRPGCGGETWAFLGSALDELDPPQARMLPEFLERGGVYFSELPPGVRASRTPSPGETVSSLARRMRCWCSGRAGIRGAATRRRTGWRWGVRCSPCPATCATRPRRAATR